MIRGADPRRRFLEQIGVGVPTRPLNVAEEEQHAERQKHQERLQACLGQPVVSLEEIKDVMRHGTITKSRDRFLSWLLVLGVKPKVRELWDYEDKQRRMWYSDIARSAESVRIVPPVWTRLREEDGDEVGVHIAAKLVKELRVHRMAIERRGWDRGRTFVAVEGEFDLHSIAQTVAAALEVEFMGGPGTFWSLDAFVEEHLVAGGAHALAHLTSKLISAADELLDAHLSFLGVRVDDVTLGWFRRLFSATFHVDVVVAIYDAILVYGLPFASFVGSAVLQSHRQRLLGCSTMHEALAIIMLTSQDANSAHVLSAAHTAWSSHQWDGIRAECTSLPPFPQYLSQLDSMIRDMLLLAQVPVSKYASLAQGVGDGGFTGRIDNFNHDWGCPVSVMGTWIPAATPATLADSLFSPSPSSRCAIDANLQSSTVVQRLSRNVYVVLKRIKGVANFISPRELLVLSTCVDLPRGCRMIVSRSVTHPAMPEESDESNVKRGVVHVSGFIFAPGSTPCASSARSGGQVQLSSMSEESVDTSTHAMAAAGTFGAFQVPSRRHISQHAHVSESSCVICKKCVHVDIAPEHSYMYI